MSIAMVKSPPVAVYREDQWFSAWVYAGLVAVALLILGLMSWVDPAAGVLTGLVRRLEFPLMVVLGIGLPPMVAVGLLRMTTEVHPTELRVWFGLLPSHRHSIPLAAIRSVEAVRYRPWRDCGGWGLRRGLHNERVFSARGDHAVRLTLHDGSTLLIGSQRPDDLARALDRGIRAAI